MNCRTVKKLILPYIEGRLDDARAEDIRQHLQTCSSCQSEYENIKKVSQVLLTDVPEQLEPAFDLWAKVNAGIQDTKPGVVRKPFWQSVPVVAGVAAVLVFAIGVPFVLHQSKMQNPAQMAGSGIPGAKGMTSMPGMGGLPDTGNAGSPLMKSDTVAKSKKAAESKEPVMIAKAPDAPYGLKNRYDEITIPENRATKSKDIANHSAGPGERSAGETVMKMQTKQAPSPAAVYDLDPNIQSEISPDKSSVAKSTPGAVGMPGMGMPDRTGDHSENKAMASKASGAAEPSTRLYRNQQEPSNVTPAGMLSALEKWIGSDNTATAIVLADKLHTMDNVNQKQWYRLGEIEEILHRNQKALHAYRQSTDGPDQSITQKAKANIDRLQKQ